MEENYQYGIWKNCLPFHSVPCFGCATNQGCKSLLSIGGDNLQFYPNFALFSTLGGMNLEHDLFSGEQIKWRQKKKEKIFTTNETIFSANSGEDLRSDAHQSQIIGGDADEDLTQIIGGIYPPHPPSGFRHPAINIGFGFFRVTFGRFYKPNFWVRSKLSMNQNFFSKANQRFLSSFFFFFFLNIWAAIKSLCAVLYMFESEMEPVRIFSTRPVNFKIYAGWPPARPAGRPVSDRPGRSFFLQKVFVHSSLHLMKNFQNRGTMSEVLKFVTPDGGLKKKQPKLFGVFLQK